MRALVTGGTGFVGGAIVRHLVRRGEAVRVLARPASKTGNLEELGVEIVRGDILDRESVERAVDGCDTLYHAAAIYEYWVPDPDVLRRTEVEGTRNALEAALGEGVGKVVYTSTVAAVGERRGETGTESTRHRGYFLSLYEQAKYEAEQVARHYVERGLDLVILQPAAVLGPGDLKSTGQGLVDVLNQRLPALFPGTLSYVDIDDVGAAHVLAAAAPAGESYILSAGAASVTEIFGGACRLAGARTPPTVPVFAARLYARLSESFARLSGGRPAVTRDSLETLAHGLRVDGSKAARELGIRYTPLEESLRRAIVWYWQQGLLRDRPACV